MSARDAQPRTLAPPNIARWAASNSGVPFVHELVAPRLQAGDPDVLICALVHGNEISGAQVLHEFLASGTNPRRGRITTVFANTQAFARFDPATPDACRFVDEDFNRLWAPGLLAGSATTIELKRAQAIKPYVERATHLLDLHSMHEAAPPWFVTGVLPRNIAFAQSLRTGVQTMVDTGHADGTRMRDACGFGDADGEKIALLLEAGQHLAPSAVQVARNVLVRFLDAIGVLAQADLPVELRNWRQPDATRMPIVQVTEKVVAQSMNLHFTHGFRGGEVIAQKGTVIGYDDGAPIATPHDRCVLVMPSLRQLRPGVTVVRFGWILDSQTE